jgi:hypothetical protein
MPISGDIILSKNTHITHITANFTWQEFIVSKDHPNLASRVVLNDVDKQKIYELCSNILQPVRDVFGRVDILSGKRSPALNTAVGGVATSDHLFNYVSAAVDFTVAFGRVIDCYVWIKQNLPDTYGQLILYTENPFIHVSLPTPKHKGEAFIV